VQTFLPYRDFRRSAAILDDRRLGKQRVETLQILRALTVQAYGWKHHPAVKMWRGHVPALVCYGVAVTDQWLRRGRADTVREQLCAFVDDDPPTQAQLAAAEQLPPWLGRPDFHRGHQSALVRKDPTHYRRYFPRVPDDLPYVWPAPPSSDDSGTVSPPSTS
jgi:hypothetical protein